MENETKERTDICVYFCFILDSFGTLSETVIGEIVLSASQPDYFEVMGNTGFMIEKGLIIENDNPNSSERIYSLTDEGKQIARNLSSQLPPALKERTLAEGNAILSKKARERSVRCDISYDRVRDRYDLNVRFINEMNGDTILDLTLYAPDKEKAVEMRERFLSKPSFIITRILNMFLKDDFFMYDK